MYRKVGFRRRAGISKFIAWHLTRSADLSWPVEHVLTPTSRRARGAHRRTGSALHSSAILNETAMAAEEESSFDLTANMDTDRRRDAAMTASPVPKSPGARWVHRDKKTHGGANHQGPNSYFARVNAVPDPIEPDFTYSTCVLDGIEAAVVTLTPCKQPNSNRSAARALRAAWRMRFIPTAPPLIAGYGWSTTVAV